MQLKEDVYRSIKKMNHEELVLIYEQISLLERLKAPPVAQEESIPLEEIHKLTSSSKSSWANSIVEDRVDRA